MLALVANSLWGKTIFQCFVVTITNVMIDDVGTGDDDDGGGRYDGDDGGCRSSLSVSSSAPHKPPFPQP